MNYELRAAASAEELGMDFEEDELWNCIKVHYICVHDISAMTKNITLTADEKMIRKAREKAFKNKTTLNNEFRLWLEKYIEEKQSGKNFTDIMKKLNYARLKKLPSREEMNER